jgi:hypothetical protein
MNRSNVLDGNAFKPKYNWAMFFNRWAKDDERRKNPLPQNSFSFSEVDQS